MLDDLGEWRLEVSLKPAPTPLHRNHMVRSVVSMNPAWYQELCAAFNGKAHRQRPRSATTIRRRDIVRTLKRLLEGERGFSSYEAPLLTIAEGYYGRYCEPHT
jgi:hypothetical protein